MLHICNTAYHEIYIVASTYLFMKNMHVHTKQSIAIKSYFTVENVKEYAITLIGFTHYFFDALYKQNTINVCIYMFIKYYETSEQLNIIDLSDVLLC